MSEQGVDVPALREALTIALAGADRCRQEATAHVAEAERWQRRIALAEQRQAEDLATEAARQARRHAALALTAEAQYAEQRAEARRIRATLDQAAPGLIRGSWDPPPETTTDRFAPALSEADDLDQQLAALKRRLGMDAAAPGA